MRKNEQIALLNIFSSRETHSHEINYLERNAA